MIKLVISGCNGKMGKVVSSVAQAQSDMEIVGGFDINTESVMGCKVYENPCDYKGEADVVIDFSHPDNLSGLLEYAKKMGTPLVIATTGLSEEQKNEMKKAAEHVPIFFSANMSLGVNLLIELAQKATKVLADQFDI